MTAMEKLQALSFWQGNVRAQPLNGGITNVNFVAEDDSGRYVVRIGDDIPVHQILRFNELAASQAAHAAGVSPAVRHAEQGALVLDFIDGRTYAPGDVQTDLDSCINLIARAHRDIPKYLRGPVLSFWVFHVIRDYANRLIAEESPHAPALAPLLTKAEALEQAVGPIDIVFGHNDLLPANFMRDANRLWLIDWDYAGFNSPLFDLGGLAANNALAADQETHLLTAYFDRQPDLSLLHRYTAMKAASALRETLWSMVSETHSDLDFDYAQYTAQNLATFQAAWDHFMQS
ncbi:choline kinase family protein [Neogemmobacter tilapiae]|uniref:Choline kinase n=1 Tax=Neogemmobacter tilapiae TaxID=875041 RepID=A0A918TVN2_9RHOB|nr:choline kinase family protein [Gemmobacter tilapiae]GHC60996.1 choline kinase [Gemmobacter tilapiae]